MLEKNAKIFVAGHRGLVGSAIWNNLQQRGYTNLVGRSHKELDLLDGTAVKKFFDEERPEAVVLAAAAERIGAMAVAGSDEAVGHRRARRHLDRHEDVPQPVVR